MRQRLLPLLAVLSLATAAIAQDSSTVSPTAEASEVEEAPRIAYPRGGDVEVPESQALKDLAADEELSVGGFINALGVVIVVGVLALAGYFLLRRGVLRQPFSKTEGKLQIKESRMLGNRQFLMVVEYEENRILLGVGPGKIDYLTSLNTYKSEYPTTEEEDRKFIEENL